MTVPIVPGKPEEPAGQDRLMFEPYKPPQKAAPAPAPQPSETQATVKKAAVGTVTVIVTLVAVFCVLPLLVCFGLSAIGAVLPGSP